MKLRVKLPLFYALLIAALGAAYVSFATRLAEERIVAGEHEYFDHLAKALAPNLANAIAHGDYAALQDMANNVVRYGEHVRYVIVHNGIGAVLARAQHGPEGKIPDDSVNRAAAAAQNILLQPAGADILDVTAPLQIAGKKLGAVRIGYSLTEMRDKAAQTRNRVLFVGILAVLAGIAGTVFAAVRITGRLHVLHRGANFIGAGDLDYRLADSGDDEIGQLAAAFNTMAGNLQTNYRAIERAKLEWETSLDAVSDPLFLHNREFRVLRCNRAYAEAAGLPFREIIGRPYYEVFPKTDGPTAGCRQSLERQEAGEEEITVSPADRVFNARFYPVRDTDDTYLYSLHILEDITERKQAEKRLKLFRTLLDNSSDAIEVIDPVTSRFIDVNDTECRELGYSREELLSMSVSDIDPSFGADTRKMIDAQLRQSASARFERVHRRRDGSTFPVEISLKLIELDKPYVLTIARDITERQRMETALRESEARYRRITEGLTDYQYTVRIEDGRAVETIQSPACATVTGYTAKEYAANPHLWIQMVVPEDREPVMKHVRQILAGEDASPIEHRIARKDGEIRWIRDTTILFRDASGKLLSYDGVIKDITEQKKAEKELHELFMAALQSLASAIEAKSPWTSGHSERVANYAVRIGTGLGMAEAELEKLRIAALLHDIGKIGTYDDILDKPGKLTDAEYAMVKRHPGKGAEMLSPIRQLHNIIPWIRGHHERFDGKGYPDGLRDEAIPLPARILAVADTFDSMTAERPYRTTPGKAQALEEIKRNAGTQFDPRVVEAFLRTESPPPPSE